MNKTEGLVKFLIKYLRRIKILDATWESYISNRICHGYVNNMWISIIPTFIVTMEMCVVLLWQFTTHWYSRARIRYTSFHHISYNTLSCLSPNCTFYSKWKKTILWKEKIGLCLCDTASVPPKIIQTKRACCYG